MKNKKIAILVVCLLLVFPLETQAKTLYSIFLEQIGFFPSVSERITLAESCGILKYKGNYDQNIQLKNCIENNRGDSFSEDPIFGMSPPDKLSKTIREDITAGTNEATITVDPLVTLQGHRLTMNDVSSTSPRLFFRIGSGDDVTWGYCTGMTDNTTTYDLTGCQLGLNDYGPGTTVNTANINSHSAGEAFVITNSHHWFDYYLPDLMTTSTINNRWIFPTGYQHPRLSADTDPTEAAQLVQKGYVDRTTNQGAATSSESVAGISELATQLEVASSTPWGVSDPHIIQSQYATTTPYAHTSIGNFVVVGKNDGYIDQAWLDLAKSFAWTAPHSFSSSTTFTATSTMATTTIRELYNTTTTISTQLTLLGKNANLLATSSSTDAQTLHYHAGNVATGQDSRASNSTGTQIINHYLGVVPSYIQIQAFSSSLTGGSDIMLMSSFGTATSTASQNSTATSVGSGTANTANMFQNPTIIFLADGESVQQAVASISAITNNSFTLNWTTNTSDNATRYFQWTVWK